MDAIVLASFHQEFNFNSLMVRLDAGAVNVAPCLM